MAEKPPVISEIVQEHLDRRELTSEDLESTRCSQDVLLKLSKKMDNWDTIGFYLSLTTPDIKAIKVDNENEEKRRIAMLNKWAEKQGDDATYFNLIEGLHEAERVDIIDYALDLLKEALEQAKQKFDEGVDSDTSIQEDLQLLCGCGQCTLDNFLKNGCPNPGVQRQFPLLNVTKLPSGNKLAVRLMAEANKVNKAFGSLIRKVCKSLESREEISFYEVASYIMSQQKTNYLNDEHYKSTQEQLRNAKTKGELMLIIQEQVSWFNHEFLGSILNEFKIEVDAYNYYVKHQLKPFLEKSLFEIPRKSSDSFESSGQFILKLDIPPPTVKLSANVIMMLKEQVAAALGVSYSAVEFCSYNSGCFELVFGAPKVILEEALFNNERLLLVLQNINKIIPGVTVQTIKFEDKSQPLTSLQKVEGIFPLTSRMTKIDTMFASLVTQFVKSVIASNIALEEIKSFLIEELIIERSIETKTFIVDSPLIPSSCIADITNLKDLMLLLNNYWSFFNYTLLEKLIKRFGTQETKDNALESYTINLQELSLSEIPVILHHLSQIDGFFNERLTVTTKSSFFTLSVEDLLSVHHGVARILRIECFALILRQIKKDANRLEFLIAKTGRDDDILKFEQLDMSSLNELHIASLQFQEIERNQEATDINNDYDDDDIDEGASELSLDSGTYSLTSYLDELPFNPNNEQEMTTESHSPKLPEELVLPSVYDTQIEQSEVWCLPELTPFDTYDSTVSQLRNIYHDDYDRSETSVPLSESDRETVNSSENESQSPPGETVQTLSQHEIHHKMTSSLVEKELLPPNFFKSQINDSYTFLDTIKGVKEICGICFEREQNISLLVLKKCLFPNVHDAPHIHVAWNSKLKKLIRINPRPHFPSNQGIFTLCDSQQHQHRQICTYAHSEVECDAWNYDLLKDRETKAGYSHNLPTTDISPIVNTLVFNIADNKPHDNPTIAPALVKARNIVHVVPPTSAATSKNKKHVTLSSTKKGDGWKVSFLKRVQRTVLQNEDIERELTTANYRDKFYHLLCFEEAEHISILSKKCDGQYKIQCCKKFPGSDPLYMCRVLGMDDNQVQYAVQASKAVYFIKEDQSICKGNILSCNFTIVSKHFFVSVHEADFHKIQSTSHHMGSGWYEVNLVFEVKHSYFNTLHHAVISIPNSMIKKITPNSSTRVSPLSLIPTVDHSCPHPQLCIDENKQLESLTTILQSPVDLPVLISGPFGSGKTRILARAAYEFAQQGLKPAGSQQIRVLMCAHHSNTTETYLLNYFYPAFLETKDVKIIRIVRKSFYRKSYSHNIIDRNIADLRHDISNGHHINESALIIITTYMSSLQVAKALSRFRFTHILLDEAAQVREPEAIAALALGDVNTKVVIAGDNKQVGPSVLVLGDESNQFGLGTSLLERLKKQYTLENTSFYLKYLRTNYRCHPDIANLLSQTIYRYDIDSAVDPPLHPSAKKFPCVFYWCESTKAEHPMEHEASAVFKQVQHYFSIWPPKWWKETNGKRDACVISPFRAQLNLIKPWLIDFRMKDIQLLPSYVIQGHEFQAVILSTLEPLEDDGTSSNPTKSLVNPKIFNTAVSRSKSLVVAVGDPFVLLKAEQQYPERCWRHYLKACLENDTIYFPESYTPSQRTKAKKRLEVEIQALVRLKSEESGVNSDLQSFPIQPSKSGP